MLKVAKVWEYGYLLPTGLEQVLYPDPILSQGMWSGNETREVVRLYLVLCSACACLSVRNDLVNKVVSWAYSQKW